MERMAAALVTASKEADHFFREVSYCSHYPRFDTERDVPDVETSNWRAVCAGKPPARFGGRGGESLPYPYQGPQYVRLGCSAPRILWPLGCFVARAPRNDGWGAADPIVSVVIGAPLNTFARSIRPPSAMTSAIARRP